MDGFLGGLAAGAASASFYAIAAVAWVRDETPAAFFTRIAHVLPPLHHVPAGWAPAGLGAVLYVAMAALLGILYTLAVSSFPSSSTPPTSLLWGLGYGLVAWWLISDVAVPVLGAADLRPLWEGLVATVVFYGVVLSEVTTMLRRGRARGLDFAPRG